MSLTPALTEAEREQYEQALLELRTLQRVAGELSRSLDLDIVLGRCLDLAVEAAHAAAGVIYLHDAGRMLFRRVVARSLSDEVAPPSLPAEAIRRALASSSLQIEVTADAPNPIVAAAHRFGLRRALMLPLRIDSPPGADELVGFLAVHFRESAPLPQSTMQTLEAISRHEALAIANARAHQVAERRRRLANGLREFSERAITCTDDGDLYRQIVDSALKLTRNDRGLIARGDSVTIKVVAALGSDRDLVGMEAPANAPYLSEAMAAPGPIVCEDTNTLDANSLVGKIAHSKGTRSYVLTALRHGDRVVGLLFAGSGETRRYEPEEREALQLLATVAGEALERVRALERLGDEKRRLGAVLERLPIVVSVIGAGGELLQVNAAGRALASELGSGGDWRQVLEQVQLFDADGAPVSRDDFPIMHAFRGEEPPPRELTLVSTDGRRRHVLSVAAPLRGPDGKVEAVVTGFQDVTSLRQLADAKDHFLRIASHELRSPLTALRATTSLMEIDPSAIEDPERRAVMLRRVHRQVDRLTRLVEQLIDSVRLNATEPPLEQVQCDLVTLCQEAIEALPDGARVTLEAAAPVAGRCDPLRIEQVLSNLLSNAARYSPPESPIRLRVTSDGKLATVEVVDRGIGIPPEQQERLFSPFFRASNAAAQSKGGLGLGLHIAREIVRRHGGTLRVSSTLGEGSTFIVQLPLG